ncbi:MAG: hypothetical protein Q8O08_10045 [Methyloversatilis sp.]|uniref:hypothetical protein n=1 Tax=Methyloversatilis sp. TaxID=2569862 RepID=UPI0027360EF6|nr:hypothetical protein [Methyloversatilis sp.]MDP2869159.1 hypothetical protein [Methyloversatilis sp.]MDP3288448.1 hypothetical protein [Methyloversatilis sp.]
MSIEKKNKDHLKEHRGVALIPLVLPKSDDPLQFWTNHQTDNTLVDLRAFADGEFETPSVFAHTWPGPFTGRPTLITELAPAVEAVCAMRGEKTSQGYLSALRTWWRLFDAIEAAPLSDGRLVAKVTSVADLGAHHEAAAHQQQITYRSFRCFIKIADAARALRRLPALGWITPGIPDPIRDLIPEDQAREIKTTIKQDWEHIRKTWAVNDNVRAEAERRARGEPPVALDDLAERRLDNWQYLQEIQRQTGMLIPSGQQLTGIWKRENPLALRGLSRSLMRSIAFPTVEEVDIAFHLALMNSGWNPSTMLRIDATNPFLLTDHPKNSGQLVLTNEASDAESDEGDIATLHAEKPRAGGWTQFCTGKKSQPSSAPMIVDTYLKRVGALREILANELLAAQAELDRLRMAGADLQRLGEQLKRVQKLERGCRCVWLYLDREGNVSWIDTDKKWTRYNKSDNSKRFESYLDRVCERLNRRRAEQQRPLIPKVTPSDFRDVYARWVYMASKGNILSVMLALGHRRIGSTVSYMENNIFAAENDETLRRWGIHLFNELDRGRIDLTILAQLVRHGSLTPDMEGRLTEYRKLMRSRVGARCTDPRRPPPDVAPNHVASRLCSTHRCLKNCPHAKFLPESLDGIAMRVEELMSMMDRLPRETWLRGGFDEELESGEALLRELFTGDAVAIARDSWRQRIADCEHLIPGLGRISY